MFKRNEIKKIIYPIVKSAYESETTDKDLRKNTLDIFSASIDSSVRGITFDEWMIQEKKRQVQKTLQNQIGELHQEILGTFDGVKSLGTGQVIDLESYTKKFIAEVKNKHNTTKGNHKCSIYDDLASCLTCKENDVIAYYVEILPKNGKQYNEPFTPPDNVQRQRRPLNDRIRRIDGKSFYTLVTGNINALEDLYKLLPELVCEVLEEEYKVTRNPVDYISQQEFDYIFKKR
jgi:hypothetical protein